MKLYNYVNTHKEFINQLPGYTVIFDLEQRIVFADNKASRTMGFKSTSLAIGKRLLDMKCNASQDAACYETHNKLVLTQSKKVSFLSYNQYFDDWKLLLGEMVPLLDDNKTAMGLLCHSMDMTNYNLVDISRFLPLFKSNLKTSKRFCCKKFSYLIEDSISNRYSLTSRQLECLFFLQRGKSNTEIARILHLSVRTVESYVLEIKYKMQCFTRSQIIEKSFSEGLLNFLPKSFIHSTLV